jgi:hypothetical membrane protein
MSLNERQIRKAGGLLGLSSVIVFVGSLVVFGNLNENFSFVNDFVSKLGAYGEPNALWWNLLGFVLVGILLIRFGTAYANFIRDRLTGSLFAMFVVGIRYVAMAID